MSKPAENQTCFWCNKSDRNVMYYKSQGKSAHVSCGNDHGWKDNVR